MTAVCHGCTAIDEVLLSWTYIHHSSDSLHEVIHSLTSFRHGRKSFTIRIKLRFADYLRNDQSERPDKGRSLRYRAVGVGMQPASCSTAGETSTTCYSAEAADASRSPKASIARPMTVSENLA